MTSRLNVVLRLPILVCLLALGSATAPVPAAAAADLQAPPAVCKAPITPVELENPTVVTTCSAAGVQAALDAGGHISFDCGADPVTITLDAPLITSKTVDTVIDGGGKVTFDGNNATRILETDRDSTSGINLTLQNLRFVNALGPTATKKKDGNARGGAVWATGRGMRLHIINSTFENNRTASPEDEDNQGGAVFAANIFETVIVGSTFRNNEAGNGGGFGAIASGLIVYNSSFIANKATDTTAGGIVRGHGGAIHLDGVTNNWNQDSNRVVDICGSTFEGNTAIRGGGALKITISDNKGTKATYARSTFRDNRLIGVPDTEGHGGAIYHIEDDRDGGSSEDNLEIRDSLFAGNYASKQGGGIWISVLGNGRIVNTTFTANEASERGSDRVGQGGGAIISSGFIDIVNGTFAENFATFQGGALFAGASTDTRRVTLYNSLFYENRLDPEFNLASDPSITPEYQGFHTNRPQEDGGGNLQYPRKKEPLYNNETNNLIVEDKDAILFVDPQLGALADNGGPSWTMAIGLDSPALDAAGSAACPAGDQRGTQRPQGSGCDIGAFELVLKLAISPALVSIADGKFTLTVSGSDFDSSSKILWNGEELETSFVDSRTLRATVPAANMKQAGEISISVSGSDLPSETLLLVEELERVYLPLVQRTN
jgi:hypothetical protein